MNRFNWKIKFRFQITDSILKEFAFIMFFCNPFVRMIWNILLSPFGWEEYSRLVTIVLIYLPVLLLIVLDRKNFIIDFAVLLIFILFFFGGTLLVHPDYEYYYARSTYGVWDYVLRPDNGFYAYLFIRLLNNPERIMKTLKKCAWIMYPYFFYLLSSALSRGYWTDHNSLGQLMNYPYSLTFGYDLLLYVLVFLYAAFTEKKLTDIVLSFIGLFMIIRGGSRGPLLCIAIFVLIYAAKLLQRSRSTKRILLMIALTMLTVIFFASYNWILSTLLRILNNMNISSRTLTMLLQGSIADDNGRTEIWGAALQMLKDNPLGYGAMGSRHVIYFYHFVGHCHQLFLEILVDYGVIAGGVIIIFFLIKSFQILFLPKNEKWFGVFIILFCRSCHLLISGTYWHLLSFWACIGVGVCIYVEQRKRKRKGMKGGRHGAIQN